MKKVKIASEEFEWLKTELFFDALDDDTLRIAITWQTGGASCHTYATVAELRAIAQAATAAADALDAKEAA